MDDLDINSLFVINSVLKNDSLCRKVGEMLNKNEPGFSLDFRTLATSSIMAGLYAVVGDGKTVYIWSLADRRNAPAMVRASTGPSGDGLGTHYTRFVAGCVLEFIPHGTIRLADIGAANTARTEAEG